MNSFRHCNIEQRCGSTKNFSLPLSPPLSAQNLLKSFYRKLIKNCNFYLDWIASNWILSFTNVHKMREWEQWDRKLQIIPPSNWYGTNLLICAKCVPSTFNDTIVFNLGWCIRNLVKCLNRFCNFKMVFSEQDHGKHGKYQMRLSSGTKAYRTLSDFPTNSEISKI